MKKHFIRFSAVVAAAAVSLLCLVGCGESKKADKLVIGSIGPLTGPAAVYGTAVKKGAELAVSEINQAGGINGMQVEFLFEDDENDPEKSVNAYNTLKDQGMKILLGTVTTNPCKAVKDESYRDSIFQLTPSASAMEITKYDNCFRVCFNDLHQGVAAAEYIGRHKLGRKIALIYNSSDTYSTGIYEMFSREAAKQKLEIVTVQAFTDDSRNDFSVAIQKVKESGADLLFLPIYYEDAALILQQAKTAGLDIKYFGCDGLDGLIKQLGSDVALSEGVMLLTPFAADAKDEKTQAFTAAYKAANGGEIPNQFAADAYDGIYVLKAALEKAGVSDVNIDPSELCDLLKKAMLEIKVDGVTGSMTWTADGETQKAPKGMVIHDGSYKAMD